MNKVCYELAVIGTSQGGFEALKNVLSPLPGDFIVPIIVVRHQVYNADDFVVQALADCCQLNIKFADDYEQPVRGYVYIAPPDKHLTIDSKGVMRLNDGKKVNHSRPAIDPLFVSASTYYREKLLAIILTGANHDGALGVVAVKKNSGTVIIQDPKSAEASVMPQAALSRIEADYTVWLNQIGSVMWNLTRC